MTQVEAKYMRLRQLTGELRGKDMEVGRLLEDKMRILAEILEEQGVQPPPLPPLRYTLLVQEREKSLTKEELLQVPFTNFYCFLYFLGGFFFVLYSTVLGSSPGPLQLVHWQSDALTTRLDFIRIRLELIFVKEIFNPVLRIRDVYPGS
jgi:hypothetical protein